MDWKQTLAAVRWNVARRIVGKSRYAAFGQYWGLAGGDDSENKSLVDATREVGTLYAAVQRKSKDRARVPLKFYQRGQRGVLTELPLEHPIPSLFRSVNPMEGPTKFWLRFWLSLETGNAYMLLDRGIDGARAATPGPIKNLWILRPQCMSIEPPRTGMGPGVFRYVKDDGQIQEFLPPEIYHASYPDLGSAFYGLSPILAAQVYAELEFHTAQHWKLFYKQGARPSIVFSHKERIPPERVREWELDMNRKYFANGKRWGAMLSHGGFETKLVDTATREADFAGMFETVREQQLSILGVPPALVGIFKYANYANSEAQIQIYWENTIIPDLTMVQEDLTERVLSQLDPSGRTVAQYDLDAIPAMQERQLARAAKLGGLVTTGIYTPNRARDEVGEPRVTGGDALFMPSALTPIGEEIRRPNERGASSGIVKWVEDPARDALRKSADKDMTRYERQAWAGVKRVLEEQRARIIRRALAAGGKSAVAKTPGIDDLWDEAVETEKVGEALVKIVTRVLRGRGSEVMADIGTDDAFSIDDPNVQAWLDEFTAKKVTAINDTTRSKLRDLVVEADREGFTIQELASQLEDHFAFGPARARNISRTETTGAYNGATDMALEQAGEDFVEGKEWVTAGDELVRDSHAALDGAVVDIGEDFANGLAYPGDQKGEPGEVCNCRCTLSARLKSGKRVRIMGDVEKLLGSANGNGNGARRVLIAGRV